MFIYLCIDSIKLSEEALQWRKYSKSDKNKNRFYKKNFFFNKFLYKKKIQFLFNFQLKLRNIYCFTKLSSNFEENLLLATQNT